MKAPKYHFRWSNDPKDIEKAQKFRGQIFRGDKRDFDERDYQAMHGFVMNEQDEVLACFRGFHMKISEIEESYSGQFYDLNSWKDQSGYALEIGRFCTSPKHQSPEILLLAWSKITEYVLHHKIRLVFGCSSFHGVNVEDHAEALTLLREQHLAPKEYMPRAKSSKHFPLSHIQPLTNFSISKAQSLLPPLLRSYLQFGAWVSDHAVVDDDLNTFHVLTAVEVSQIPKSRRRKLIQIAKRFRRA